MDHLVIGAADLDTGAAWFRARFGVDIGAGGRHPLMGTHNHLLDISAPGWDKVYLELIAVDPHAPPGPEDGRLRWFGLDDPRTRHALSREPRLLHFVARTPALLPALQALAALGEDVGEPVAASRPTAEGMLQWQISVRRDGVPQHGGALPALIEWRGVHPVQALPPSLIRLVRLRARTHRPQALICAYAALGLEAVEVDASAASPALEAAFETPLGPLVLHSAAAAPD